MIYIPLHDICLRADIPEIEIQKTQLSKSAINDLQALVAKHGLHLYSCHKIENLADNDYRIYRQRLANI